MKKNNLKQIKASKGISGLKLSQMTGIAPSIISNIENYRIVPYPGWKKRIAKALDVCEDEIFPSEEV